MDFERRAMLQRLIRWIRTHNQKVILISSTNVIEYIRLVEVPHEKP